jgi:hypothetical protein
MHSLSQQQASSVPIMQKKFSRDTGLQGSAPRANHDPAPPPGLFPFPEAAPAWRLMSGGICWIATLEFFAAQAIAQAAWKGSYYSLAGNAISDLGVTACGRISIAGQPGCYCSPLHSLMNASFAATGILMLLGLCLTLPVWPAGRLACWGITWEFSGLPARYSSSHGGLSAALARRKGSPITRHLRG